MSLTQRPAEVRADQRRAQRQHVDLLGGLVTDVADQQQATGGVDREAPRVAQAEGDDLRAGGRVLDVRVPGRDRVRGAGDAPGSRARVDPQQLAVERGEVLARRARGRVAGGDPQQTATVDLQLTAVVLGRGRPEVDHAAARVRIDAVGVRRRAAQLVHPQAAAAVDVHRVQETGSGVVVREGDREEAALVDALARVADQHAPAQVGERPRERAAVLDHADQAGTLDDEQTVGRTSRSGDIDRLLERPDLHEADAGRRCESRGRRRGEDDKRCGDGEAAHRRQSRIGRPARAVPAPAAHAARQPVALVDACVRAKRSSRCS
jgi:hypothetical protein